MKPPPMSEGQLQALILDECRHRKLLVHHCRPAQIRAGKWVTPISGNGGFPDLVITGAGGTILRELKNTVHQPTDAQMVWLSTLEESGIDSGLWRPNAWDDGSIHDTLARLAKPRPTDAGYERLGGG